MTERIAREHKRLSKAFRRALVAAAVVAQVGIPFVACSSDPAKLAATTGTGGASSSSSATGVAASGGGGAGGSSTVDDGGSGGATWAPGCEPALFIPDAADDCGAYVHLACGVPDSVDRLPDCYFAIQACRFVCGNIAFSCHALGDKCLEGGMAPSGTDPLDVDCSTCLNGAGRATAGFDVPRTSSGGIGEYFAAAAVFEGVSVHAFRRLHADLGAHGAPRLLRRAARAAKSDERRHADVVGHLARRFGASPERARAWTDADATARALEEVALENAVEGCVRETFGALVASFQAEHAGDATTRRAFARIAADESRHAALAWAVARWSLPKLAEAGRAAVYAACEAAIADVERGAANDPPADAVKIAGLPSAAEQRVMLDVVRATLWSTLLKVGPRERDPRELEA